MAGNIYNIGFIYFLLKHVYKLRKDEEMIFLYTHHRKHIKTTIFPSQGPKTRWNLYHWVGSEFILASDGTIVFRHSNWVVHFWYLYGQWEEILWALFSVVLLSTPRWEPTCILNLHMCSSWLKTLTTCVLGHQAQRPTLCVPSSPCAVYLQFPFTMLSPLSFLHDDFPFLIS